MANHQFGYLLNAGRLIFSFGHYFWCLYVETGKPVRMSKFAWFCCQFPYHLKMQILHKDNTFDNPFICARCALRKTLKTTFAA